MKTALLGAAVLVLSAGAATAQTTCYDGARWWTPDGFLSGERCVADGRFAAATPDAQRVDLGGVWVIPALGEAHNHNLDNPAMARAMSDTYLSAGILYVKNPNSRREWTDQTRAVVNQPDTVDAIFSLGGVTAPGGHPVRLYGFLSRFYGEVREGEAFEGDAFHLVTAEGDIAPVLDRLKADGADFVKLYLLGSEHYHERAEDPAWYGLRGVDPALAPAFVREARARDLRVSVHVETAADFRAAVAAGVDEINHLPGYMWETGDTADTYRLTDADADAAAEAGVVVVTTTVIANNFARTPEALAPVQALQVENLRRLHDAGVPIVIGSDSYQATAAAEAQNLLDMGAFTAPELLRLWIDTPRISIFPDRMIGRLDDGYEANFVVLSADPLTHMTQPLPIIAVHKAGEAIWTAD
jgi:cytosine/adenosine deaminase-related metal-dependent hydrolase